MQKNILGITSRNPIAFARALALIAGIETIDAKGRAMGMDASQLDDLIAKSGDALIDFATGAKADKIAVQLETRGFRAVRAVRNADVAEVEAEEVERETTIEEDFARVSGADVEEEEDPRANPFTCGGRE
jgi:hypothetical protein